MSDKPVIKPLAIAVGTAIVTSLASVNVATAAENPFAMTELSSGYMVAEMAEGNVTRDEFMSAHESMFSKKDKNGDGVIDASEMKMKEGKCGEGKCGGAKATGEAKTMKEGKCGEGKCGANK
jgi:uncharacterized low-complexity protein